MLTNCAVYLVDAELVGIKQWYYFAKATAQGLVACCLHLSRCAWPVLSLSCAWPVGSPRPRSRDLLCLHFPSRLN